ncbi:HAMP domain-containing sensor histidine kinase [Zhihengliuella alba]|uniref:histidine kinase n=1 Tax=Zhihengliuella alba TaxID=547018 RepID=A0ABP7E2J9_9MICC
MASADPSTPETADRAAEQHGSAVSVRWRIVGWIVLTTAVALLAVTVTMRSVMAGQVAEAANDAVVQEIDEFRAFAAEGLDPRTARPFSSLGALMEHYVQRQQPMGGEAIVGVAAGSPEGRATVHAQGIADDSGAVLAGDEALLQRILDDPAASGVYQSDHGPVRWGKAVAMADGAEPAQLVVAHFTAAAEEAVDRQSVLLLGVAVGGLGLTAGIAWLVSRQILRPIRTVRETADAVTATDLSARIPVAGRDDLAQLAQTLNAMLDRVEDAHLMQRHFVAEAREHLREPQRRIAAALDELVRADLPARERVETASRARQLIGSMGRTLADLDLLAQSSRPDFVRPVEVPVGEVTADIAAEASAPGTHAARHVRIEATAHATARLDRGRIADAMRQLVENAVAHTGPGDTIRIGSAVADGVVDFWVANPGAPLEPEAARELFESYRGTHGRDAGEPGMGLGLAVVKAVAEAHGGAAWVESADDAGTAFGISFPAAGPAPAARRDDDFADRMAVSLGAES